MSKPHEAMEALAASPADFRHQECPNRSTPSGKRIWTRADCATTTLGAIRACADAFSERDARILARPNAFSGEI